MIDWKAVAHHQRYRRQLAEQHEIRLKKRLYRLEGENARLRAALEEAAAYWRPVARDLEHDILSIDSVRFLAQDFLAMLQPTLEAGGES